MSSLLQAYAATKFGQTHYAFFLGWERNHYDRLVHFSYGLLQRDFAREWARSFAIKDKRPLGEDELVRLWRRKK